MQYATIAVYFAVLLLLGALASRRVKSLDDYYLGGKRLGFWVAAFSARATGRSNCRGERTAINPAEPPPMVSRS